MPPLPAFAQVAELVSRVQMVGGGTTDACPVIVISLAQSVSLQQQIADAAGRTLVLRLRPDAPLAGPNSAEPAQTVPSIAIPGLGTALLSINLEAGGPVLTLRLSAPAEGLTAVQAGDRTLLVTVQTGATACATAGTTATAPTPPRDEPATTAAPATDLERQQVLIAQARTAIIGGKLDQAIELLTQALALPESVQSPAALELLGVTRERNGQSEHAKAEYQAYLDRYPTADGAERVKQRLAALEAMDQAPTELREMVEGPAGMAVEVAELPPEQPHVSSIPRSNDSFPPLGPQPGFRSASGEDGFAEGKPESNFQATVSGYYYRNQSSTLITELEDNTTDSDSAVLENSVVLSFSASDERKIGEAIWSWEIDGDYERDLSNSGGTGLRFSNLSTTYALSEDGPAVTFGRHRVDNFGPLGRVDGVSGTYPLASNLQLAAVAGLVADSSSDPFFAGAQSALGLAAVWTGVMPNLDLTAYAVGEVEDGYTSRLGLGFEASYVTDTDSIWAEFDYDAAFAMVNSASVSWSHMAADKSSYSLSAAMGHSPSLTLDAALTGQAVTSLADLGALFTLDEMQDLASDRAAMTRSVTLSWRRPIDKTWAVSLNGSISDTLGTPASGGVVATDPTGLQSYASLQFLGSGVFTAGDAISLTGRLADTSSSQLVLLDTYWSHPVNDSLKLKPRIQVAHRNLTAGGTEDFVIPSMALDYEIDGDTTLDLEAGMRISNEATSSFTEETNEAYVTLGITRSF